MTDSMISRMMKKTQATYIVSSPWVLAAAAALLVFIIATFALHNYRREKSLMLEAVEQRAATMTHMLYSNLRTTLLDELRQYDGKLEALHWREILQQMAVRISEEYNICFLSIANPEGEILAHTVTGKRGEHTELALYKAGRTPQVRSYETFDGIAGGFVATIRFTVFDNNRPGARRRQMQGDELMLGPALGWMRQGHLHMKGRHSPVLPSVGDRTFLVAIGMDTQSFEQGLERLKGQILLLSLAMSLVGLGGWLSLAAVQGYRISQQTVEKAQAYNVLLVAQLPLGVIATTPEGVIETWNAAMEQLTGIPVKKALRQMPQNVLPPDLAVFFDEREYPESGPRVELEMGGVRRVLLCRPVKITDALQSYRGRVLLLSDITEMSDMEQSLRENERLAAIGRIAGGVAHEVRNPLSSIKGLAFLLKNKFPAGSRERASANLLMQETERLNRTITEMLDLTRPAPLRLAPVNMGELIRQSLELMRADLAEHRIEASARRLAENSQVLGDADRLRQVLLNVLVNARQAMDKGGILTVATAVSADGLWLEIEIADTGHGVPPEFLPHIFDPYVTTRDGGTGIGLAISHKIITEHKGTIAIKNGEEKGTKVNIRLPLLQSEEGA